jgi:hypothetical protein
LLPDEMVNHRAQQPCRSAHWKEDGHPRPAHLRDEL